MIDIRNYRPRVVDQSLAEKLQAFGAVLIVGPKSCGKTTTAMRQAESYVEFQDEDVRDQLLAVAQTQPSMLLRGNRPRLFDEWQDAPKIWGAIRQSVDDENAVGAYILTGSTSHRADTPHTGTGRISRLKMLPMSLHESGQSNGTVSLRQLFDDPKAPVECVSELSVDELIFAICRGGWPRAVNNSTPKAQLAIAKDLYRQICETDISAVDGVRRNPLLAQAIMRSYARNICTLTKKSTVFSDAAAQYGTSRATFDQYIDALESLFIIDDVPAWSPSLRSKTAIRGGVKRNVVDPSLAVAALGVAPEYFNQDFKTLGFLFESLCIRDLRVYSSALGGQVSYYRDRYGLEADIVLHIQDGRYALIEVKLGAQQIDAAAKNLLAIESLVQDFNASKPQVPLRMPDLKIVVTATQYGYRRDDGVIVLPVGCLRP